MNGAPIKKTTVLLSVSSKLHDGPVSLPDVAQATLASLSSNSSSEKLVSRHYAECNATSWSAPMYYTSTYTDAMKLCLGRDPVPDDKILTQHGTEMTFGDLMRMN